PSAQYEPRTRTIRKGSAGVPPARGTDSVRATINALKVKRRKGRKVERSKGRKVKRSKGQKVKRQRGEHAAETSSRSQSAHKKMGRRPGRAGGDTCADAFRPEDCFPQPFVY